jgi:hypothetical protein
MKIGTKTDLVFLYKHCTVFSGKLAMATGHANSTANQSSSYAITAARFTTARSYWLTIHHVLAA